MEALRLGKSVRSVVRLETNSSGGLTPIVLYERKNGKKSSTPVLRDMDRALRRIASAQQTYFATYLDKHNSSNRKRRDGWARDLPVNLSRATRKAINKLQLIRLLSF